MSIGEFIKDRMTVIICNMIAFVIVAAVMAATNVSIIIIVLMFCVWYLPLISYMIIEFVKYKNYYDEIYGILERLDKKYLLPEVVKKADSIEGEKINCILKEVCRDMHENVKYYRGMQEDYREYIEMWVHEIKTPIASAKLVIENNKNEVTDKIDFEMDKIGGFVEQVLYYSRSNDVHKDYIIKQIKLDDAVRNVVKRNYRDFIHKKIKLNMKYIKETVCSDEKWIEFIINQVMVNSIKYSDSFEPMISIYSVKKVNFVELIIEDNGVGISEKDVDRVFEKGFTGENGRKFSKSTGMGLYLCKKLCSKLGLKINIESKVNIGTRVTLIFPLSDMLTFTSNK